MQISIVQKKLLQIKNKKAETGHARRTHNTKALKHLVALSGSVRINKKC